MRHIILTGFMGSGKTTVGILLAPLVGLTFVDADQKFEERFGLHPSKHIRCFGEESFRKCESLMLKDFLNSGPVVLATGGGMVLSPINRRLILNHGFVVFLETSWEILLARLQKDIVRPLLPKPIIAQTLRTMLAKRDPLYRKSHWKILTDHQDPKEVAIRIVDQYKHQRASRSSQ